MISDRLLLVSLAPWMFGHSMGHVDVAVNLNRRLGRGFLWSSSDCWHHRCLHPLPCHLPAGRMVLSLLPETPWCRVYYGAFSRSSDDDSWSVFYRSMAPQRRSLTTGHHAAISGDPIRMLWPAFHKASRPQCVSSAALHQSIDCWAQ